MTIPNTEDVFTQKRTLLTDNQRVPPLYCLFILAVSILTLLICTKSSPLYPFNDWGDSNIYFTMGKSILNGKVLYRDVFDHKGPVIFFLHAITYLISNTTFFGVFLLEIVTAFFFLLLSYKTMLLFVDKKSIIMIPVLSVCVYPSWSMRHGDSAEELCLPMLMYAVYIVVKSLKNNEDMTKKQLFLLGFSAGFIFWLKFTIAGFYAGFLIIPVFSALSKKDFRYIGKMVFWGLSGLVAITLPILLYFISNDSMYYLWDVYFNKNIFMYTDSTPFFTTIAAIISRALKIITLNPGIWLPVLVGGIWLYRKNHKKVLLQMFLMYLTGLTVIYAKGYKTYYALIFAIFCFIGMIAFYEAFHKLLSKLKDKTFAKKIYTVIFALLFALIIPISLLTSSNTYMLSYEKGDLPQYKFKEIITDTPNPTLLNFGFLDGGFYTTTGIIPSCRFFCTVNLPLAEMYETQAHYVNNGLVDYVITRDIKPAFVKYEVCSEASVYFEGTNHTYYLYKLKDVA